MFNSGFRGRRENDGQGSINPQAQYVQNKYPQPYISGWSISGTDDTSLNPAGGQTVLVNGSGFAAGVSATVGGVQIGSVTLVNPTQISFTAPANSGGSYTLIVYNSTGGAAILVPGLVYSAVPTWTTAAGSIGSYYETTAINSNVVATSDSALTYALTSGSLPSGATLYANGVITGTAPVDSGSTTYTFDITATDAELQDTTRTFTLTINVDVVTWVAPTNGTTYTVPSNVAISNVSLSATDAAGYGIVYSANSLPTGVSLTGSVIAGTPTTSGNTSTLLTATANTTGRTATNTINWVVQLGDSYWNLTTLALNSLPTTIPFQSDASLNNASITPVGDTKSSPYNPYQTGYYSNYFDGTGDSLTATNTTAFAFGTGDFTVEFWIYPLAYGSSVVGPQIFGTTNGSATGYSINLGQDINSFRIISNASGGWADNLTVSSGNGPSLNVWTHMAVVRSGANLTIYKNGVSVGTTASAAAWNFTGTVVTIGYFSDGTYSRYLTGYISNLRAVKGLALYTTTFTPSTTPLVTVAGTSLLTCQSQRLIDTSPNNFAITKNGDTTAVPANPFATVYDYGTTYYSTYFDGSGDYVTFSSLANSQAAFGSSSAFTAEAWVYPMGSTWVLLGNLDTGAGNIWWTIEYSSGMLFTIGNWGVSSATASTSATITQNVWTHVVVQRRTDNTVDIYYNGIAQTVSNGFYGAYIGYNLTAGTIAQLGANGYATPSAMLISNFRFTRSRVYTGNFTPSTTPLTAISGTSVLTCQSSTTVDNSTNAFTLVTGGQARPVPQSPFYSAYYSGYFDGSGDYLTLPSNAAFALGTADFTVECWIYATAASDQGIYEGRTNGSGTTGFTLTAFSTSVIRVYTGAAALISSSGTTYINVWTHVAVVRSSGTTTLYINGTSVGTSASMGNLTDTNTVIGGGRYLGTTSVTSYFSGYISNFRIVKGQALYTSTFTPSTTPLTTTSQGATAGNVSLLTCQSLYFIDNSTNVFAITTSGNTAVATVAPFTQPSQYGATTTVATYGSGYFDGTGDYLTIPSSGALTIGTSSATVEFWIYPTSVSGYQRIVTSTIGGFNAGTFCIRFNNGTFAAGAVGGNFINSSTVPAINSWSHIVWVGASGTTQALYINGVSVGTSTTYNITEAIQYIGGYYNVGPAEYTNGYISNLRIVKGTALYTANFLPSPTPLTAVTNTQLLTLQYNGGSNDSQFRDGSNFQTLITRNGNTTQGTFSPFSATGWSGYFDGTGDYLNLAANAAFAFGTGDFTVECWVNYTNKTNSGIFQIGATLFPTVNGIGLGLDNGPNWMLYYGNGSQTAAVTGPTNGVWYHVAVVRSSSVTKVYVNGSSTISTADSANYTGSTLGIAGIYSTSYLMNGYISNFRVTKGQALYTTTFTPATSPLTTTSQSATAGNVSLLTLQSPSFIDNSANRFTITSNGDSKTQSFSPFSGVTTTQYYSNYFDGSGDYLSLATNAAFDFSTGSFTVEAWVYPTSLATDWFVISATGSGGLFVGYTGGIGFGWGRTAVAWDYRPGTLTANTWQHVAVTRSGTSMYVFVNGTQAGTTQTLSTAYNLGATATTVGSQGANYYLNGYISNLRVVKGQALYTTNFTPATSPLTTTSQSATAANVSLLTCQSSTFIDNSTNAFAITVNGDTIPTTIAPFAATSTTAVSYTTSVNGGSMYFDGSGDYLSLPTGLVNFLSQGISSWTIEFWSYHRSTSAMCVLATASASSQVGIMITLNYSSLSEIDMEIFRGSAGNFYTVKTGSVLTTNTWNHIAITWDGSSTFKMYVNGISRTLTTTGTRTFSSAAATAQPTVGTYGAGNYFSGWMSNFRILVGTVAYTSSFSPPTAPPVPTASTVVLLNGTNGSIIDYTGKNDLETVGDARLAPQNPYGGSYYSNYFDGTGDYLNLAANAAFGFGTGDFTVEFWLYLTASPSSGSKYTLVDFRTSANHTMYVANSAGTLYLGFYNGSTDTTTNSQPLTVSSWYHCAWSRGSGTLKIYVNGAQAYSAANSVNYLSTGSPYIGASSSGGIEALNGYISNLRITKGQALYTTTFTPATSPLTTTSQSATAANVSLLTCQSSTFKDNSTNAFTITRNGDTAVNSVNPFQNNGTYSMYFDGTGDYNYIPATANFQFGTGDFTIEFWLYLNSVASNQVIYDNRNGANGAYPTIYMNTSSIRYYTNSADQITGATLTTGQWYYIAVCKASGSTRLFVNGTQSGSTFADSMNYLVAPLRIGADYAPSSYLNGYVTDLRVTKYARYTTTFTPPTSTFQTK